MILFKFIIVASYITEFFIINKQHTLINIKIKILHLRLF